MSTALRAVEEGGRREHAKEERRQKILQAVRELIRETGDTNLSMRTIAKRADVSLTTPYNLFGSKRAIVMAVLEDERDFVKRMRGLKVTNALERLFEANALAVSYFAKDPDFYRPLWRALLDTSGKDDTGLVTPERQTQTRAAWQALLVEAQDQGLLVKDMPADVLERMISHHGIGVMQAWASGTLSTGHLMASAGLGYALLLAAAATPQGRKRLDVHIARYRGQLAGRNS